MAAILDGAVCLLRFPEIFVRIVQPIYFSVLAVALLLQDLAEAIDFRFVLVVSCFELSCKPFLSPRVYCRYCVQSPDMQATRCAPEVVHA